MSFKYVSFRTCSNVLTTTTVLLQSNFDAIVCDYWWTSWLLIRVLKTSKIVIFLVFSTGRLELLLQRNCVQVVLTFFPPQNRQHSTFVMHQKQMFTDVMSCWFMEGKASLPTVYVLDLSELIAESLCTPIENNVLKECKQAHMPLTCLRDVFCTVYTVWSNNWLFIYC